MIGWRVGWVVAPPTLAADIGLVHISNATCNVGIAQAAATIALETPDSDLETAARRLEKRRDVVLEELDGYPVTRPAGGWSLLVDVARLGMTAAEGSGLLMERGKVAATPMTGWGSERSAGLLRLVFSNEPVARLRGLGARFDRALRSRD